VYVEPEDVRLVLVMARASKVTVLDELLQPAAETLRRSAGKRGKMIESGNPAPE
jgi:hypothetical protein